MNWTLLTLPAKADKWPAIGWIFLCVYCGCPTSFHVTLSNHLLYVAMCRGCPQQALESFVLRNIAKFRKISKSKDF